jgi:hypothetical protein
VGEHSAISRRLKTSLAAANKTPYWLHVCLRDEGIRGSGYASVRSYVRGEVRPGLEFVRSAADALGVQEEWLESGEGEMTSSDEELGQFKDLLLMKQFRQQNPPGVESLPADLPSGVRNVLLGLAYEVSTENEEEEESAHIVSTIANLFEGPFGARGFLQRDELSVHELMTYTHAFVAAVRPVLRTLRSPT